MTAEEIELWKFGIEQFCNAMMWSCGWLGLGGIGRVSVENVFKR